MIQDNILDIKIEYSEYIKGDNIPPSTPSSLWLLPIENNTKLFSTNIIWVYNVKNIKKNDKLEDFISVKKIKEALILLINEISIISGTIGYEDDKGNIKINLNNQGILFLEAKSDKELDDIIPNRYTRYNKDYDLDYFNSNSLKFNSKEVKYKVGEPIISIQITKFICNSIIISLSGQHCLFDADTMGQFMKCWTEIVKTGSIKNKINWNNRNFLMKLPDDLYKFSKKDIKKPFSINYYKKNVFPQQSSTPLINKKIINRIIHFTQQEIENLKKEAIKFNENKKFLSSYDVIYAYFIHCIYLIQMKLNPNKYDKDELINISQAYNGRNKFGFNFNNNYFGSFAFWLNDKISHEKINNFSELAYFIHDMHFLQTKENLYNCNLWLIPSGNIGYYENYLINDMVDKDFHISSWAKGNHYSVEFIEGIQPDYVGPSNPCPIKIMILLDCANNKENNKTEYDMMLGLYEDEYEELMKIIHKYR